MKTESIFANIRVRRAAVALVIYVTWVGKIYAAAGTAGASFLDIPVGAGPAALGSAYGPLATDAYAPIYNPAGLGFLSSIQIAAQHLSYIQSTNEEFLSGVLPFKVPTFWGDHEGRSAGVGFSAQYFGSGDITQTDINGNNIGNYSDNFGAYSLAYGQSVTDRLSLGLTGKWITESLAGVGASGFGADVGSYYRLNEKVSFSGVMDNLGSKVTLLSDGDSLPLTFHLGGAYKPSVHWTATAEALIPTSGPAGVHVGGEWKPVQMVAIRAGYRTDTTSNLSALAGFSTGIGLTWLGQEFSYAWVPYGELGDTNYFSLVLRFGGETTGESIQRHERRAQAVEETNHSDQQLEQILNAGSGESSPPKDKP